jgi:hypothetical protein
LKRIVCSEARLVTTITFLLLVGGEGWGGRGNFGKLAMSRMGMTQAKVVLSTVFSMLQQFLAHHEGLHAMLVDRDEAQN